MPVKWLCALISLLVALLIGLSAYIEHGLKDTLTVPQYYETQKAFWYFIAHAILLLSLRTSIDIERLGLIMHVFAVGMLLFSGSLYLHALFQIRPVLAPMGGISLIVAWLLLAYNLLI